MNLKNILLIQERFHHLLAFQIKIVMVGKNQAKPPKIKELRGIALA